MEATPIQLLKPCSVRIMIGDQIPNFTNQKNLRDLNDCGIDVLQSCNQNANMDIPIQKAEYGTELAFMRNIDVDLLANGEVSEVENTTQKLIMDARQGGGFILRTSKVMAAYCRPENLIAMYRVAHGEIQNDQTN